MVIRFKNISVTNPEGIKFTAAFRGDNCKTPSFLIRIGHNLSYKFSIRHDNVCWSCLIQDGCSAYLANIKWFHNRVDISSDKVYLEAQPDKIIMRDTHLNVVFISSERGLHSIDVDVLMPAHEAESDEEDYPQKKQED